MKNECGFVETVDGIIDVMKKGICHSCFYTDSKFLMLLFWALV